jgi:hypothetical protein
MCNHCHAPITIQHLLIDCEKFREQQAIMWALCRKKAIAYNKVNLLNGNIDFKPILEYLKDTDYYNKV